MVNIQGINIICTCSGYPTQYEGTVNWNNKIYHMYVRYRWGYLALTLSEINNYNNITDMLSNVSNNNVISIKKNLGDKYDSILDFRSIINNVIELLH